MPTISAFADEISPDLKTQMDVCESVGVHCIDVRGISDTNVSKFTLKQTRDYKKMFDDRRFTMPCVGSPLGKVRIDEPFTPHLDMLKHCCDVAQIFGAKYIRIFSFYGPEGGSIVNHRQQVMDNLWQMVKLAEEAQLVLLHENEHAIYGDVPSRVKELFATIKSPSFQGIFDPANFVHENLKPFDECWTQGLAELTQYFHIKDKAPDAETCCPAGEGHGQITEILTDAKKRGFDGYMTLEPHMMRGGQFFGFTGPDLFLKAAQGLRKICDQVGMEWK
jgi:sugar phosphate isomerase/epimerase